MTSVGFSCRDVQGRFGFHFVRLVIGSFTPMTSQKDPFRHFDEKFWRLQNGKLPHLSPLLFVPASERKGCA